MKLKAKKIKKESIEYLEINMYGDYIYKLDKDLEKIDEVLAKC